jgi:trk system potassium uptake protein
MWLRLRINDVRAIVSTLGTMVVAVALTMLIPLVVALACGESKPASSFLFSFGAAFMVGSALRLVRPKTRGLTRMQALVVTGLAWVTASVVSALPFVVEGLYASPFDAFFDAVSCYTGTGMSLIQRLSHLPYSFGIWRMIMVVIGANGIVIMALALGTISKFSGAGMLFEAEGHQDKLMPGMADTSRFIVCFLGAFIALGTVVLTLLCWALCGMSPLRALYHGFSLAAAGATTGGITVMDVGAVYYHQPLINAVLICLMLTGTFSFAVYLRMATKGPRELLRDVETRMILAWSLVVLTLLAVSFAQDGAFGDLGTFLDKGVFNAVSALTGTGFCTLTSSQLTGVASRAVLFCFILGMAMGGATSSTAGGIKAIRVVVAIKTFVSEVRRVLMPSSAREVIRYYHLGQRTLTDDLSRNAMIVFLLFMLTYLVGGMAGVLFGVDPLSAMLESISCTNNCGISAGVVSDDLPVALKCVYLVQMLAGRLEFVTLLATVTSLAVSCARGVQDSAAWHRMAALVPENARRAWQGKPARRVTRR